MNLIGYREDEETFLEMLKRIVVADPNTRLSLATGYLNLQKEFSQQILNTTGDGKT